MSLPSPLLQPEFDARDLLRQLAVLTHEITRAESGTPPLNYAAEMEAWQARLIQETHSLLACEACVLILNDEAISPASQRQPQRENWLVRKALSTSLERVDQKQKRADKQIEWIYQASPRLEKGLVHESMRTQQIVESPDVLADHQWRECSLGMAVANPGGWHPALAMVPGNSPGGAPLAWRRID